MSTTSLIDDAQQQMRDMSQAVMRLSWAMTVLGAQQAANMVTPSKMAKSGENLASALDAVTTAIEGQLGSGLKNAYRTGAAIALSPLEGLPSYELNQAMNPSPNSVRGRPSVMKMICDDGEARESLPR